MDFSKLKSRIDRIWQNWLAHDLEIMRISLYTALAIHLLPTLLFYQENYAADVFRLPAKNMHLYGQFVQLPTWFLVGCAAAMIIGLFAGIFGWTARIAALLTLLGTYVFLQGNAVNTQTLGMQISYGIVVAFLISGAGSNRLTLAPYLRIPAPKHAYGQLARWLIVTYALSSIFLAGLEKFFSDWVQVNMLYHYLSSPNGVLLRDWAAWFPLFDVRWIADVLAVIVVAIELSMPLLFFWHPARKFAVAILAIMLVAFTVSLQIPLLFPAVYLPALVVGLKLGHADN